MIGIECFNHHYAGEELLLIEQRWNRASAITVSKRNKTHKVEIQLQYVGLNRMSNANNFKISSVIAAVLLNEGKDFYECVLSIATFQVHSFYNAFLTLLTVFVLILSVSQITWTK